jgi:hypothetical protein
VRPGPPNSTIQLPIRAPRCLQTRQAARRAARSWSGALDAARSFDARNLEASNVEPVEVEFEITVSGVLRANCWWLLRKWYL